MNRFLRQLLSLSLIGFLIWSCDDERVFNLVQDGGGLPPEIDLDGVSSSFVLGDTIEFTVAFSDGLSQETSLSPLATASVSVLNQLDDEIFSNALNTINSTSASINVLITDISLPEGEYRVAASATDTQNNTVVDTVTFMLTADPCPESDSEFASEQCEMFILGQFNGWGGTDNQMTLVADNLWVDSAVVMNNEVGTSFKFSNMSEFDVAGQVDWGDDACDNQAEVSTGVQTTFDINREGSCGFIGEFTVLFNDLTLEYELIPGFDRNLEQLFVLGTFNNFQGTDAPMALVANNEYEIRGLELNAGDEIRFSSTSTLANMHFGDNDAGMFEMDSLVGTAEEFGSNIAIPENFPFLAEYDLTFNDTTLQYSVVITDTLLLEEPGPPTGPDSNFDQLFIIGNFTGWGGSDSDQSVELQLVADNTWEGTINATMDATNTDDMGNISFNAATDNIVFKIVDGPDFGGTDFGDDGQDFIADDTGSEANIEPGLPAGTYFLRFNDETLEYSIGTERNPDMFIIGNFTGWGGDNADLSVEMRLEDEDTWAATIDPANFVDPFTDPAYIFKFVEEPVFGDENTTILDWGAMDGNASLLTGTGVVDDEVNFEPGISMGLVDVTFNDETLEYSITAQ
ncbi:MAG: hypothetical protein AAF363_16190 [Bacteroidota bacterium]